MDMLAKFLLAAMASSAVALAEFGSSPIITGRSFGIVEAGRGAANAGAVRSHASADRGEAGAAGNLPPLPLPLRVWPFLLHRL